MAFLEREDVAKKKKKKKRKIAARKYPEKKTRMMEREFRFFWT